MRPLAIPTINSNDVDARLISWAKESGDAVKKGELLATLETTKAVFEFDAETDGFLERAAPAGVSYPFGTTIGYLFDSADERTAWLEEHPQTEHSEKEAYQLSDPARLLVEKHGISDNQLRKLGRKIVRARDLEPLIAGLGGPVSGIEGSLRPSALQLGIARVVEHSRQTIPTSYVVQRIYVDPALAALAKFTEEEKVMVGLPELLIFIVSRLPAKFPFFFGELSQSLDFRPSAAGNIGVTYDFGKGLYVPVVKGAARLSLREIAKQMMGLKMKALRHIFKNEELSGGDISISLNTEPDIDLVLPIILPPQTCFLALNGISRTARRKPDGQWAEEQVVKLAAAFDHRVINGAAAGAFLSAIKRQIESKDPISWKE